jgi:superfamily II DNA or RNA helicase
VLRALGATREHGYTRGLVVMATGLGKTYLSAFDFLQHQGRRALFVAHVDEILQQAASRVGPRDAGPNDRLPDRQG